MAYCVNCGNKLDSSNKFCPICGTPAGIANYQAGNTQQSPNQPYYNGNPYTNYYPEQTNYNNNPYTNYDNKSNTNYYPEQTNYSNNQYTNYYPEQTNYNNRQYTNYYPEQTNYNNNAYTNYNNNPYANYSEQTNYDNDNKSQSSNDYYSEQTEDESIIDKYGMFYGIGLLILALICYHSDPPLLTLFLSAIIIAGGIFCLVRRYRLKGFTIVALIIAVICVRASVLQAIHFGILKTPIKSDHIAERQAQESVEEEAPSSIEDKNTSKYASPKVKENHSEETSVLEDTDDTNEGQETPIDQQSTDGVDPELKAFLDSYESFMNEYISFYERFDPNAPDALSMISEYASIMDRYSDFTQKIDEYNSKKDDMSKEDIKYYMDVLNRVNKRMIDALPDD